MEDYQKYFSLHYELLPFPVQVVDEKGFVIYVNGKFSAVWGYTLSELKEYSVLKDSVLVKREIADKIKKLCHDMNSFTADNYVDSLLLGGERTIPFFKTTFFPVNIEDKTYVVLFHEDQTEITLAEEEVKKARDTSKEAERLKGTFLNVLSHELRTPLNIILGYSTIIRENLKDKISSEDKIYLDNLYSGSERLFKSITQMLEFAQIEAGNYQMNLDTFDLVNVIRHCLTPHKKKAMEKHLDLKTSFEEESIFVEIDLQCAESVINNLLDNAVKFTRQGFIDVEVGVFKERELAVCKVKDTGVGISTEYLDHLYQPFSQEDLEVGRNFEGNGLGLAISKRYIEKMGGSLIVDSIKGVGTTFTVTLPLAKVTAATRPPTGKHYAGKMNGRSKILMLDDAGESYDLIKAFLKEEFEIELVTYNNFSTALLEKEMYSAIIFDVTKNYWDKGLEFCRTVKSSNPYKTPVVILSSEFLNEKIQQFYRAGADEFLVKPFAKNVLVNLIGRITSPVKKSLQKN